MLNPSLHLHPMNMSAVAPIKVSSFYPDLYIYISYCFPLLSIYTSLYVSLSIFISCSFRCCYNSIWNQFHFSLFDSHIHHCLLPLIQILSLSIRIASRIHMNMFQRVEMKWWLSLICVEKEWIERCMSSSMAHKWNHSTHTSLLPSNSLFLLTVRMIVLTLCHIAVHWNQDTKR